MNEEIRGKLASYLSGLHTDMLMLMDGDWQPVEGDSSIEASLDAINEIALLVNVQLTDTRDK